MLFGAGGTIASDMPFRPDIVVVAQGSPSRILLVVETKLRDGSDSSMESQLKRYMLYMSCPVGLLVTPTHVSVYRDTYTRRSEDSIERMGPYPVPSNWIVSRVVTGSTARESDFEKAVRSWLEQMGVSGTVKGFPQDANDAFDSYVIPALSGGVIRGSGPPSV